MPEERKPGHDVSVGRRIAAIRHQRGYDQHGLAQRAHLSYSTITKIETGHMAVSPMALAACARALRVPVTELTGQPYVDALRQDQLEELVQPLRYAIVSPDPLDIRPRSLAAVRSDIAALESSRIRGEYLAIGVHGPALLEELVTLAAGQTAGRRRERAFAALASMYCLARYFTHKLGFIDLGLLALEQMEQAALHAGDPCLPAVLCHYRADYLLHHGGYDRGLREVERMEAVLAGAVRRGDRDALSVQGTLHLKAAVTHARRGGAGAAGAVRERIEAARAVARRRGDARDPYGLIFDARNVAVHEVSTRIDLGDPAGAVAVGEALDLPAGWALNRRGHHLMDMARAYEQVDARDEALSALISARDAAPAQTRYHPTTRETTHALLRRRGEPSRELRSFARWLGV
jgi:transcriptional regulator with XRE-family HTH domain